MALHHVISYCFGGAFLARTFGRFNGGNAPGRP
jgi:hypothetical protein